MVLQTAQGPMASSEDKTLQPRHSGRRLRRPGAIALFLAVLAIVLVACGGGSGEANDQMPSVSSGEESTTMPSVASGTEADTSDSNELAPDFAITLFQGEEELGERQLDLRSLHSDLTEVVLNLEPGNLETELVHIHQGRCGNLGGIVHALSSFVDGSGSSTTVVKVSLDSLSAGEFAINAHKKGDPGVYTSCGNIPAKIDSSPIDLLELNNSGQIGTATLTNTTLPTKGKPIILNFWAGLCPPCRAEMPDLQAFYEDYKDRVTLVGIDLGQFTRLGNQQDAIELLKELSITYPAGSTTDVSVVKNYSILGMPTTVFIDAEGSIFKSWTGALNRETLENQTNKLLNE